MRFALAALFLFEASCSPIAPEIPDSGDDSATDTGGSEESGLRPPPEGPFKGDVGVDLRGTFALETVRTSLSRIPFVGMVSIRLTTLEHLWITEEQSVLAIRATACDIQSETDPPKIETIFSEDFIRGIPVFDRTAWLIPERGGIRFYNLPASEVVGAILADPARDPLPENADDERVRDQDGDSHPGVTVRIAGFVSGEIYAVQRNRFSLDGNLTEDGAAGLLFWEAEQKVLGADNPVLTVDRDNWPDPDASKSTFRLSRLADGATCADILEKAGSLFGS